MSKSRPLTPPAEAQAYVLAVMAKLANGQPLDAADRFCAANILGMVLSGRDPRVDLGIKPKRGPQGEGDAIRIAADYWDRKKAEPKDAIILPIVAKAWGRSESYVFQLANKHREEVSRLLSANYNVRGLVNYFTSSNPGN